MQQEEDWEITAEGLYRATRGFLIRRGYCCGSRCTNCPYVNWRMDESWRPLPAENIRRMQVARRSVQEAGELLAYHQEELVRGEPGKQSYHQEMVQHYQQLLERWKG